MYGVVFPTCVQMSKRLQHKRAGPKLASCLASWKESCSPKKKNILHKSLSVLFMTLQAAIARILSHY